MKLTFLGTGAGECYPSPWCECTNCDYARKHGGKNLRNNSSLLIDDDLLIDLTAQAYSFASGQGISLAGLKTLLVTHNHTDHFTPNILWTRLLSPEMAALGVDGLRNRMSAPRVTPLPHLTICGNRYIGQAVDETGDLSQPMEYYDLSFHRLEAGESWTTGNTVITGVSSLHVSADFTLNYIIQREGKTILYASDTGGYSEEMQELILSHRYDAVVVEGTTGLMPSPGQGHMSLEKDEAFFALLRERGAIDSHTYCCLTHMSPHWTPPHDLLEPMLKEKGLEVAYDGQIIHI